jgi:DNA-binding NarL/FixJ family response regulator
MDAPDAAVGATGLHPALQCMLRCAASPGGPARGADPSDRPTRWSERVARFLDIWSGAMAEAGAAVGPAGAEGLLAASPDPPAVLMAALRAREAVRSDPLAAAVPYRAAMHVGSVVAAAAGGLIGIEAAVCEQVLQEARTGSLLVSEACAGLVRHALPRGYELRDVGAREMAGLDRPIGLLEVSAPQRDPTARHDTPEAPTAIRMLLAEDDRMLREALAGLLRLDPGLDLVGTAPNGRVAVSQALALAPDVVLMDIEMPEMNGIEATRRIKETCPDTEVLILTKFGDDESVFDAVRAGALGYMLKDAGIDEIGRVVRSIRRKEGFISPALVPRLMREFGRLSRTTQETRALFAELSRREIEVLELLGAGLRNRAIGEKLFISEKTVKNHISNILAKLQVNDRTAAALLAREHGMARPEEQRWNPM